MPLIDKILAAVFLLGTGGFLAFRTVRAWADFRLQRRTVDLLVRSMSELDSPTREPRQ